MTLNNDHLTYHERPFSRAVLATLALLAVSAVIVGVTTARAHGNPTVGVEPNPVAFGGDVTIEGEEFEEDAEISLVLEGVLGEISLGNVTTDAEGLFSVTVTLPSTAGPGSYRIRAVGADDVAVADLRILEGEGGAAPAAEHEAGVGFHGLDSPAEIAGFAALAAVLVLAGVALLWLPWKERHI